MPILKPEPDSFPDDLFELPVSSHPWWVAHIRSRHEKAVAREALSRGVAYYLPQREQRLRTRHRTRLAYVPLFPAYLFFRGSLDDRLEILKTNLCIRVIEVVEQTALDSDLRQVFELQTRGLPLVPWGPLDPGEILSIREGPFAGFRGTLLRSHGKTRLVVAVRFIHRAVCVELEREFVVPVRERTVRAVR